MISRKKRSGLERMNLILVGKFWNWPTEPDVLPTELLFLLRFAGEDQKGSMMIDRIQEEKGYLTLYRSIDSFSLALRIIECQPSA
jgi:hypothetical protein